MQMHSQLPKNILLVVAYDGERYMGWQKTPTGLSVEQILEETLEQILQHKVPLQAASRTDRGVHAHAQVVNFFTENKVDLKRLHRSLNQLLPNDISILAVDLAPSPEFHPTLSAKAKEYHYQILHGMPRLPHLRHTHWHTQNPLDIEAMNQACPFFIGRRDFKAFCNNRKGLHYEDTIREIFDLKIVQKNEHEIRVELLGNNFLYKMARNIVGTLAYVGMHKIPLSALNDILSDKVRAEAGITAPSCGLALFKVYY